MTAAMTSGPVLLGWVRFDRSEGGQLRYFAKASLHLGEAREHRQCDEASQSGRASSSAGTR